MYPRIYRMLAYLLAVALFLCCLSSAWAAVRVRGYTRKDGTYVAPHYRSNPDGNFWNNWSTKGNVNPYTGKPGTRVTPPNGYGGSRSSRYFSLANRAEAETPAVGSFSGMTGDPYEVERKEQQDRWEKVNERRNREPVDVTENLSDGERSRHAELTNNLASSGTRLTWRLYTPDRLNTMKERIEVAERVADLGLKIPWQMRTLAQLEALEQELMTADSSDRARIIEENTGVEGVWWELTEGGSKVNGKNRSSAAR